MTRGDASSGAAGRGRSSVGRVTNPTPPDALVDVAARLPIASRLARDAAPTVPSDAIWAFAPLAPSIADAVATAFGVRLGHDDTTPDPIAHPAFAALYASARTEQVIREVSARTNLVLAGTTAVVAGDGPLAASLTAALTRIGVRVQRETDDPVTRLATRLAGLSLATPGADIHYLFLTGERATARARNRGSSTTRREEPLADGGSAGISDAVHAAGLVVDVSATGRALHTNDGVAATRASVRVQGGTRILTIDGPLPHDLAATSALPWRILDGLVALSILTTRGESNADDVLAAAALTEVSS
jgi:hypothetical protein